MFTIFVYCVSMPICKLELNAESKAKALLLQVFVQSKEFSLMMVLDKKKKQLLGLPNSVKPLPHSLFKAGLQLYWVTLV